MNIPASLRCKVESTLLLIFGDHPHQVSYEKESGSVVVTVTYHDFLTPHAVHRYLSAARLPVQWDIDRSMSTTMQHRLLDELYEHPERLLQNHSCHGNVRLYILDRFATTDF